MVTLFLTMNMCNALRPHILATAPMSEDAERLDKLLSRGRRSLEPTMFRFARGYFGSPGVIDSVGGRKTALVLRKAMAAVVADKDHRATVRQGIMKRLVELDDWLGTDAIDRLVTLG